MNYTFVNFISSDNSLNLNWHHIVQAKWINRWLNNEFKNLMILAPPRSGKTMIASRKLPLYIDDQYPDSNTILATHSVGQAQGLERAFNKSHIYKNNNIRFIGNGQQLTGCRANYIIMDDVIPHCCQHAEDYLKLWQWYYSSLVTRGIFGCKQLLIASRWDDNDLPGHIMELNSFRNDWVVIKFPLIAEQDSKYRKKGEVLWNVYDNVDQIKANSGNLFNALYQQNPIKQLNEY